ncbi:hypothetical protein DERP_007625 [Dermatophagoides pteronyssinus]|uniref:Uncharacterized protein n=1 Tax=Dermatophagoides pteronyssinus TaxID=6956 RepID=A0ABQ8JKS0_DERPT|nr:hypothetical protein DERP_007625 [Dermatophagoides pteronyssinus]
MKKLFEILCYFTHILDRQSSIFKKENSSFIMINNGHDHYYDKDDNVDTDVSHHHNGINETAKMTDV